MSNAYNQTNTGFQLTADDWDTLAEKALLEVDGDNRAHQAGKAIFCYENAARVAGDDSEKQRLQRCADEIKVMLNT